MNQKYTGSFAQRKPQDNNYTSQNNLLMKMKVGNPTECLPACHAHGTSALLQSLFVILAAAIANTEHHVSLCLPADEIQF
jgi:hypothetical protein